MKYKSLPFRINTAIIVTAVVIVILFGMFLYPLESRRIDDQIQRIDLLLDTIFEQKLNDLANELFARQERALNASLDEIAGVKDVLGAAIYLPDGTPYLSNHAIELAVDPVERLRKAQNGRVFQKVATESRSVGVYLNRIEVIGQVIGYIAIFYDFTTIDHEMRQSIGIFSGLLATTVVLMGLMLNLFLFRSIIKPVSLLRNAMRRVEEGFLGETVFLPREDEIGEMGAAFNDMSIRLRQVRQALVDAEEKYRSIFENAIEGIFQITAGQGRFITVNSSLVGMLRYTSEEELLSTVTHIQRQLFVDQADARRFESDLRSEQRIVGFETELWCRDRGTVTVSISARRVADASGHLLYIEGSVEDITERRQREEAERKREAAEAANRAKSEFLAYMSHEIRTPINAILGFADILETVEKDERKKQYVQIIKSSGASLLQLINDILDLSKIEAGRMEIKPEPVNLGVLFNELYNLFSIGAADKGVELAMAVPADLPRNMMLDKVRLRQVLFNLIGNAVKYTSRGAVKVAARIEPAGTPRCWDLEIEVSDTGIGIAPEAHEEVFKSFRQYQNQSAPLTEGTGLGLPISKNLVEMMGGVLKMESILGKGSSFAVLLPRVREPDPVRGERAVSAKDDVDDFQSVVFEPVTILVADDLEMNRQLVVEGLKQSPLTISEAANGKEAVALACEKKPRIILMDIKMPELDGYAALSQIRDRKDLASIPVVALTASGMKEDIQRINQSGFDDYLIRPFSRQDLIEKLKRFLKYHYHGKSPLTFSREKTDIQRPAYLKPWSCSAEAAELLQGSLKARWEEAHRKQRIPDIHEFGKQLADAGVQYDSPVLADYGAELCRHSENFQIDQIQVLLENYPKLLCNMKIANADQ